MTRKLRERYSREVRSFRKVPPTGIRSHAHWVQSLATHWRTPSCCIIREWQLKQASSSPLIFPLTQSSCILEIVIWFSQQYYVFPGWAFPWLYHSTFHPRPTELSCEGCSSASPNADFASIWWDSLTCYCAHWFILRENKQHAASLSST